MIIVVGESLGKGGTRSHLASLFGVSVPEMMARVLWINLWEYQYTTTSLYVEAIERMAREEDHVLLLGRRVVRAFGLADRGPFEVVSRNAGLGPLIVPVPHPSGLNRWYNAPAHRVVAELVLSSIWRITL